MATGRNSVAQCLTGLRVLLTCGIYKAPTWAARFGFVRLQKYRRIPETHLKNQIVRLLALIISFVAGTSLSSLTTFLSSHHSASIVLQNDQGQTRDRAKEIMNVLMPNGVWADASKLEYFEREEVIRVLKEARSDAKGARALGFTFLLAALNDDYDANKSKLMDALSECRRLSYPDVGQCADFISSYLMDLGRMGDASVLKPLFDISDLADGGFAQALDGFYSDMLKLQPRQFLLALAPYPRRAQVGFCYDAAMEDGGGMDETRLREVKEVLNVIAAQGREPLATLAKNCSAGILRGKRETSR